MKGLWKDSHGKALEARVLKLEEKGFHRRAGENTHILYNLFFTTSTFLSQPPPNNLTEKISHTHKVPGSVRSASLRFIEINNIRNQRLN